MKLLYYVCITFVLAFAAQYWIISYITSRNPQNSRGKFYLSAFFASMMGILEVMIYDSYRDSVSLFYYVGLGLLAYGMIFAYNTQMGVADEDYLKQMLEHQSRDILLADRNIKNTESQSVRTIATNILNRRKRDVDMMTKMLADLTVGPITGKKLFTKETYAV